MNEAAESSPRWTVGQKTMLAIVPFIAGFLIRLLGCTLRYEVSIDGENAKEFEEGQVFAFWHQCILLATYRYRNRNVAVLTSQSFDGELIARTIQRLGFVPVRGSSSRGAVGGLMSMYEILRQGRSVAFTADGPRGPRYVAKPGPLFLAEKTGALVRVLHFAPAKAWRLRSWDGMLIPKPFSRVSMHLEAPLRVTGNNDLELSRLQAAMDNARSHAESHLHAVPWQG
jgi:lysophospholipid acyltransferase (LPLAT)-like uncharacterized protein